MPLKGAGLHALGEDYTRTAERALAAETRTLERTSSNLVNSAYGLTCGGDSVDAANRLACPSRRPQPLASLHGGEGYTAKGIAGRGCCQDGIG